MTCSAVMAVLSDYLDGDLDAARAAQVEAHVAACQQCAQFGAGFAQMLTAVKRELAVADDLAPAIIERLRDISRHQSG
jgi:anti-sigma factor RsiW